MSAKNKKLKNRNDSVNENIQNFVQLMVKLGAKLNVYNYCPSDTVTVVITNITDSDGQSIELDFDNKTGKLKTT